MSSQALSLYSLIEETAGVYSFVSDQGFTFNLSFQVANVDDGFADVPDVRNNLLIVTFRPVPELKDISKIRDPRIAMTIVHYLEQALNNGYILNYLCSDLGGFERHRRIMFGQWYQTFERKGLYDKFDYDLLEEKTKKHTYLGFLIKKDNPLYGKFYEAVDAEIELYQKDK